MSLPIHQSSPLHKAFQPDATPQAALAQASNSQTSNSQTSNSQASTAQPIVQSGGISNGIYLSALVVALPIFVGLSIIIHRKRRAALLRQRIETLERIWRLTYRKTTS